MCEILLCGELVLETMPPIAFEGSLKSKLDLFLALLEELSNSHLYPDISYTEEIVGKTVEKQFRMSVFCARKKVDAVCI